MKCTVVDLQEVFLTLTHKHSEGSKQSPLSVKCLRLHIEQSCMGMSSVWITLGSQTHIRARLHLPLLFASILSDDLLEVNMPLYHVKHQSAVHETSNQPSCVQYVQ